MRKALTDSDRAAWAAYAARISPLRGRATPRTATQPDAKPAPGPATGPDSLAPPAASPTYPQRPPKAAPSKALRRQLEVGESPGGIDGANWHRLRRGKFSPERRLDLHGFTAQRAHYALVAFLRSAHADRLRCVEVITGRGSGDETGVLRRELPMWLNLPDIRPLVLAAAYPHAANPGAVRLLLRRVRQDR